MIDEDKINIGIKILKINNRFVYLENATYNIEYTRICPKKGAPYFNVKVAKPKILISGFRKLKLLNYNSSAINSRIKNAYSYLFTSYNVSYFYNNNKFTSWLTGDIKYEPRN
ncbi:hypothetical protein [Mycoplasma sp. P36-A1]|uniref:hypothetical protein n=1 Tax=Mycoplasma sp. P36-A1 TaxID=3252900 RepID=UPI003C2F0DFB